MCLKRVCEIARDAAGGSGAAEIGAGRGELERLVESHAMRQYLARAQWRATWALYQK